MQGTVAGREEIGTKGRWEKKSAAWSLTLKREGWGLSATLSKLLIGEVLHRQGAGTHLLSYRTRSLTETRWEGCGNVAILFLAYNWTVTNKLWRGVLSPCRIQSWATSGPTRWTWFWQLRTGAITTLRRRLVAKHPKFRHAVVTLALEGWGWFSAVSCLPHLLSHFQSVLTLPILKFKHSSLQRTFPFKS